METKPRIPNTSVQLGPVERSAVSTIQDYLKPDLGSVSLRTAISWALSQAKTRIEREERRRVTK